VCNATTFPAGPDSGIDYTADGITLTLDGATVAPTDANLEAAVIVRGDAASSNALNGSAINGSNITTTAGSFQHGVWVIHQGTGSASFTVDNAALQTTGNGVFVMTETFASTGNLLVTMTGGSITSLNGSGIQVSNEGLGSSAANITGGTINARNIGASAFAMSNDATITFSNASITSNFDGLSARVDANGNAFVHMQSGSIRLLINNGTSISAEVNSGSGSARILIENGWLEMGSAGAGARVANGGTGEATIEMRNGRIFDADGIDGVGLAAFISNASSTADAKVLLLGGELDMRFGDHRKYGIVVTNNGTGDAIVTVAGGQNTRILNDRPGATGIRAETNGGGNVLVNVDAVVQGGSLENPANPDPQNSSVDYAITTRTNPGAMSTINIGPNAVVSALTGLAIANNGGDSNVTIADGANVTGAIYLDSNFDINNANGNDTLRIVGSGISGITVMDGGDDHSALDGSVDTLILQNQNATALSGANIRNWENVVVEGGSVSFSDNALTVGSEVGLGLKITGGGLVDGGSVFALTGNLAIESTGTFQGHGNGAGLYTVSGDFRNAGRLSLQDGFSGDKLRATGDYLGAAGTLLLDTVMGSDTSATDQLQISGNASGNSVLNVTNAGGPGAATTVGIDVITVAGTSAAGSFTLAAPVLAGAYQYVLKQGGNGGNANDWYLVSTTTLQEPGVVTPKAIPIYRPAISAYSVARSINSDVGFMQSATLHQRMGEQAVLNAEQGQSWARLLGQSLDGVGKERFDYSQKSVGLQAGRTLWTQKNEANGTLQRAGFMVQGVDSRTDASDRIRPAAGLAQETGKINTRSYGLGGYYTAMRKDGSYLDLTAQANQLRNDFSDSYGSNATQDGRQLGLSAELGAPLAQLGSWTVEGQGQLTYLSTNYKAFSDNYSNIDSDNFDALRGRLGVRVHNAGASQTDVRYYGIGNLVHDLIKTKNMAISDKNNSAGVLQVHESFDQAYVELGVGVQAKLNDTTWIYADARYEHGLKNRKDTAMLTVGVKF
jgi:outer membrane autotransporter protein